MKKKEIPNAGKFGAKEETTTQEEMKRD